MVEKLFILPQRPISSTGRPAASQRQMVGIKDPQNEPEVRIRQCSLTFRQMRPPTLTLEARFRIQQRRCVVPSPQATPFNAESSRMLVSDTQVLMQTGTTRREIIRAHNMRCCLLRRSSRLHGYVNCDPDPDICTSLFQRTAPPDDTLNGRNKSGLYDATSTTSLTMATTHISDILPANMRNAVSEGSADAEGENEEDTQPVVRSYQQTALTRAKKNCRILV